jgi:hypothetical protein
MVVLWTGAAEDGRGPTEERSCVVDGASDRQGRTGEGREVGERPDPSI